MQPRQMQRRPGHRLHNAVMAVIMGWINAVKRALESGTDVNAPGKYGYTPLMIAVMWNRTDIVELLLDAGADVKATNRAGHIASDMVAEGNNQISLLLARRSQEG